MLGGWLFMKSVYSIIYFCFWYVTVYHFHSICTCLAINLTQLHRLFFFAFLLLILHCFMWNFICTCNNLGLLCPTLFLPFYDIFYWHAQGYRSCNCKQWSSCKITWITFIVTEGEFLGLHTCYAVYCVFVCAKIAYNANLLHT